MSTFRPPDAESGQGPAAGLLYGPEELSDLGTKVSFAANERLIGEGEHTDFCLVLRRGSVRIVAGSPPRFLAVRGAGEIVGEQGVLMGVPRSASVYAMTDGDATWIAGPSLRLHTESSPAAYEKIARIWVWRGRESDQARIASFYAVERRLAIIVDDVLSAAPNSATSDGLYRLDLSQRDLASMVGASRESVAKVVRVMNARGVLRVENARTVILDRARLRRVAAGDKV